MNRAELLHWLKEEHRKWQVFLDQIEPSQMEELNVVGHWSIKDVIGHLTGWNRKLVANLRAALDNEPEPPLPWPAHLQTEDEINAWHYETHRPLSVSAVREEADQVFEQLLTIMEDLPDDVLIETVQPGADQAYHLVCLGDQKFLAGEFFHHFHDDHESEIRAWLDRADEQ